LSGQGRACPPANARPDAGAAVTGGDRLAQAGHPLKPRTIQTALSELEAAGLAVGSEEGNGRARYWSPTTPKPEIDSAGDGQPDHGGGAGMA
jgi:hypothetical protein